MVEKIFSAEIEQLGAVTAFLEEELEKADCSPKLIITFEIALEELFVNVARYAYPDSKGTVKIGIDISDGVIALRFIDSGIPFNPVAKPDPDITEKIREIERCILSAKLVVFDDIGDKNLSPYDLSLLYYWIDTRTSDMKSCIYTTNQLPKQLEKTFDGKLYSRIVNYSEVKIITDGDHRGAQN